MSKMFDKKCTVPGSDSFGFATKAVKFYKFDLGVFEVKEVDAFAEIRRPGDTCHHATRMQIMIFVSLAVF